MSITGFIDPSQIRAQFSSAMSAMYRTEVPLYGDLLDLVADTNARALASSAALKQQLCLLYTSPSPRD